MVTALDTLVAERPADAAAYTDRLRAYLEAHPAFYGSAAALLDHASTVTTSPYVYRTADGYATRDLAGPVECPVDPRLTHSRPSLVGEAGSLPGMISDGSHDAEAVSG